MFKSILDILDRACLSPEREGQEMLPDGSILFQENSAVLWHFEGANWKAEPVEEEVHIRVLVNSQWKLNSKLTDMEMVVEFGQELVQTLLEQEFENEDSAS